MFHLSATMSSVSVDANGRPREFRQDGRRLIVSSLDRVRDETAAYPLDSEPRTVFVVTASGERFRLVYLLRHRRWTVEPLGAAHGFLEPAA